MENQLVSAYLLDNDRIEICYISDDINSISFSLLCDGNKLPISLSKTTNNNQVYKLEFISESPLELGHIYKIKTSEEEEVLLRTDRYVATEEFDKRYYYGGNLGIRYSKEETSFKLSN